VANVTLKTVRESRTSLSLLVKVALKTVHGKSKATILESHILESHYLGFGKPPSWLEEDAWPLPTTTTTTISILSLKRADTELLPAPDTTTM